ncbi:hypothetical protein HOY82DRAFT_537140 [Tuber indicum]|nr:hypothetical protein HOY82DRAFT_537140 [Tuber indicum]
MCFSSNTGSYLSSPPAILRTPSPLPEFIRSETIESEPLTADYSEVVEFDDDHLLPPNAQGAASRTRQKRKAPRPVSLVWGPPESLNGLLVVRDNIEYQKSHKTSNPGAHLIRVLSIHEEHSAHSKRLKQAQQSIERSMEVAATAETQRIRDINAVIMENNQQ